LRKILGTLAVLSLAVHLLSLPPTLEDLDSVNFALGVRDFDLAQHQPHPPGYPMFIAIGKLEAAVLRAFGVQDPEVRSLSIASAIAAAALVLLTFAFFRALDQNARRAAIAAVLAIASPVFWFTGVRPLSDMSGLAVAMAALALIARAVSIESPGTGRAAAETWTSGRTRLLVCGALVGGLSIGFRSQMAFLTLPFLALVLILPGFAMPLAARVAAVAGAGAGIALWGVPLILVTGGPGAYLHALRFQADADLTGVVMLWSHRTVRTATFAILHTFVRPWDSPVLAGVMLALAGIGLLLLALRSRRVLLMVAATFVPYAAFHLLFQETITIRYALPLVLLVAYLAAVVLSEAGARGAIAVTAALAVASLAFALPATAAFSRVPSPIFGLLSEMRLLQSRGAAPVVAMHRRVFTESRRARVWAGEIPGTVLPAPRDFEWLEITRAWREGYDGETWFVADPRRTDLALVDGQHRRIREYRWPFNGTVYVGGARPDEIDWHVIDQPGWFLEQGWALTPEVAGITERDGWGPHRKPSIGWVRRRPTETLMMLGGRHLGGPNDPPVRIVASIDERPVATLDVRPGYFLEFITLPAETLSGDGRYAKLTVRAEPTATGNTPRVAIEQFNLQGPETVQFGYGEGWYEPEYNPVTARSWRWMSEKAVIRVRSPGRQVVLRFSGESPLHYFKAAPLVQIRVGERLVSEITHDADFRTEVTIPGDVLTRADGRIDIISDRSYVPGDVEDTADRRRLALRVYSVTVE
jgi:hypothetical protein